MKELIIKQGRKRPLDTPKKMIERREREKEREREFTKQLYSNIQLYHIVM